MPPHRLRRRPAIRIAVLVRALAVALALALLVAGCGGAKDGPKAGDKGSSADDGDSGPGDDDEPAPDPGYQAPKQGQCYRMTPAQSRASVSTARPVGCQAEHNSVIAYVGYVQRVVTPKTPLAQRRNVGKRLCEPAYRRLVGGTLADRATSILTWTMFTPGQDQLERGARWVRCDVIARSGNRLVPLPSGQPLLKAGVPDELRICQNEAGIDISCSGQYSFKVEAVYRAVGNVYPDPVGYTPVARNRCKELMGAFGGFWQPPSSEGWQAGDRFIRCLSRKVAPSPSP